MNIETLHNNLSSLYVKINKFKEEKHPEGCSKCMGLIQAKAIYGIWMDLFMLIINSCNYAIEASKASNIHVISDVENCLDDVLDILNDKSLIDNMPDLFKVGLSKYLPDYISRMNGADCLYQVHSQVLKIKEKV